MGVSSAGGREGPGAGEVRGLVCSGSERSGMTAQSTAGCCTRGWSKMLELQGRRLSRCVPIYNVRISCSL